MDFDLNSDQRAIVDIASKFARSQMAPHAARWDKEHIFPKEVLRQAAELGFAGIYIGDDVGGSGLTRIEGALIFEQLSQACPSTAAFLSIHNMVSWMIDQFGTTDQRQHWLPQLVTMDKIASYCLTEPGAGSDAAQLRTSARLDGDDYVINGTKAFISGGPQSDLYAVMCRTGGAGPKGISCILVEKGTSGLSFGALEHKLGWHSQPTSMVMFDDVRVPIRHRIGAEGDGFKIAMKGLDGGRLNIGACSIGGGRACLEMALNYTSTREQFGQKISDFQATKFRLADMVTELEAARLLLLQAADKLTKGHSDASQFCAMAKRLATDTGFKLADEALQLHGGYGYLMDYPVERFLRDLRVHRILEGTNEIMRVIIARHLMEGYPR